MKKKLTEKEKQKFKELYLKGYSATMIFKELGQDYQQPGSVLANSRMARYRKLLGLPKRGTGFRPSKIMFDPNKKRLMEQKRKKAHQQRIKYLQRIIPKWQKQIEDWKKELTVLTQNTEAAP